MVRVSTDFRNWVATEKVSHCNLYSSRDTVQLSNVLECCKLAPYVFLDAVTSTPRNVIWCPRLSSSSLRRVAKTIDAMLELHC